MSTTTPLHKHPNNEANLAKHLHVTPRQKARASTCTEGHSIVEGRFVNSSPHSNATPDNTQAQLQAQPNPLAYFPPRIHYRRDTVPSICTVVYEYEPAYKSHAAPLSTANVVAFVVQSGHNRGTSTKGSTKLEATGLTKTQRRRTPPSQSSKESLSSDMQGARAVQLCGREMFNVYNESPCALVPASARSASPHKRRTIAVAEPNMLLFPHRHWQ